MKYLYMLLLTAVMFTGCGSISTVENDPFEINNDVADMNSSLRVADENGYKLYSSYYGIEGITDSDDNYIATSAYLSVIETRIVEFAVKGFAKIEINGEIVLEANSSSDGWKTIFLELTNSDEIYMEAYSDISYARITTTP